MADEKLTPPKGANLDAQERTLAPQFYYPSVPEFTGVVQARVGAGGAFDVGDRRYFEGETFRVGSKAYADRLVESGNFTHVAADTPIGRPEPFIPKAPPPPQPATAATDSGAVSAQDSRAKAAQAPDQQTTTS